MWLALSAAGIVQAFNPGVSHSVIERTIAPLLAGRAAFGVLFTVGAGLFAYNVYFTATKRAAGGRKPAPVRQVA